MIHLSYMTYEQALELKKAGFPRKGNGEWGGDDNGKMPTYYPTLSELIEACGEQRSDRDKFVLWWSGKDWRAGYYEYGDENYIDCYPTNESGSTPEEAVANLWLELNKTGLQKMFSPEVLEPGEPYTDGGVLDNFGIEK